MSRHEQRYALVTSPDSDEENRNACREHLRDDPRESDLGKVSGTEEHMETKTLPKRWSSLSKAWIRWSRCVTGSHNWEVGLRAGLCASIIVLVGNISLLVVGAVTDGGFSDGIGTIAKGQSRSMIRLSTAYHILINICSTVLLTSSNYAMQLLCAPTRADIDKAHRRGHWVEIGLMSFRNLRYINSKRVILWTVLALSSAPLHLL